MSGKIMDTEKKVKIYFLLSLSKKAQRMGMSSQASYLDMVARVRDNAESIRKTILFCSACLNLKKRYRAVTAKK